ncbi:MAG: hypothetical protein KDH96_04625 [Candidatus Riesia sp.]|nr:hypothetical protein [Candidatus Riesia sp.]
MSINLSEEYYDRQPHAFSKITIGVVEKVDDTLQQLRLYVRCPALGDYPEKPISELPVCFFMSPLLGETIYRDDGSGLPEGSSCYGLLLPPRVGAQAIVTCIDDNADLRVCLGFINTDLILGTFPNGRYTVSQNQVIGPLTSDEYPMAKQCSYQDKAFGFSSDTNHEKISRCFDRPISKLPLELEQQYFDTNTNNDEITMDNGKKITLDQGYVDDPNLPDVEQKAATVYGLTTPMGHTIYCDDAPFNSKIKLRTAKGSQVILDDSNERIYINTAEGNSWFEMDFDGNVDMFCYNYNVHATNDVNITADKNVNVKANNTNVVNINDTKFKQKNLSFDTIEQTIIFSDTINETFTNHFYKSNKHDVDCVTFSQKSSELNFDSSTFGCFAQTIKITGNATNITGSGQILLTGGSIHFNGPAADVASSISITTPTLPSTTNWTKRRPDHEPWPRMSFAENDIDHTVYKFSSTDVNIGKENVDNLMHKKRNAFWRR